MLRLCLNLLSLTLLACCLCSGDLARPNEQPAEQPDNEPQPKKPKPLIRKPSAGKPPAGKPSGAKPGAGKSPNGKSAAADQSANQQPANESSSKNTNTSRSSDNPAAATESTDRIAVMFSPTIVPVVDAGPRFRIWFANGDRITIHQPAFDHDHVTGVSLLFRNDAATPIHIPIAQIARIDQLGERTLKWTPEPQPITEPQTWDFAERDKDLRVSFRAVAPEHMRIVFRLDQGKAPVAVQPSEMQTRNDQSANTTAVNDPVVTTQSLLTVLIDPQRIAVLQGTSVLLRHPLAGERVVSMALEPAVPAADKSRAAATAANNAQSKPATDKLPSTDMQAPLHAIVADFLIVAVSPDSTNPLPPQLLFSGTRGRGVLGGDQQSESTAGSTAPSSAIGSVRTPPFIVPGPSVRDRQRDLSPLGTDASTNGPQVSAALQLRSGDILNGSPAGLTAEGVTWRVAATTTPVTIPWTEILAVQMQPIERQADPAAPAGTGPLSRKLITSNVSLSDPESRTAFEQLVDKHRAATWHVSLLRPLGQFDTAGDRLALRNIAFSGSGAAAAPTGDIEKPIRLTGEHSILGQVSVRCSVLDLLELDPTPAR